MPIHDVGYRNWRGVVTATWTRWWVIAEAGLRTALKSRWTRRMMLASWLPVFLGGWTFFFFENTVGYELSDRMRITTPDSLSVDIDAIKGIVKESDATLRREFLMNSPFAGLPHAEALLSAFESDEPNQIRNRIWCWLLMLFFRYPQGLMTLMLVGLVVPPLIARDVRSNAFLLYYARPIGRLEYILGKLAIPAVILMLITLVPALALYSFGVMLSPNMTVVLDTWDIPVRIGVATAVGVVPTCIIALMCSAATQESRFAGFAWFAIWGLGAVVWTAVYSVTHAESQWSLISLYSTVGRVQSWVFGLEPEFSKTLPSMIVLTMVTLLSTFWLYRRVSAPIRL